MPAVVRFDAELLVHQTTRALGCNGGLVVVERLTGWNGSDYGSVSRVVRCVLRHGHCGDHRDSYDDGSPGDPPTMTECGQSLTDGAWIDWAPGRDDPRCAPCYGIATDEQEPLL